MKQWKKSSRWRKARDKAYKRGDKRNWIRIQRLAVRPGGFSAYFGLGLQWEILHLPALNLSAFSESKPFPKNMGATTIRFIQPA